MVRIFVDLNFSLMALQEECANATHWMDKDVCMREFSRDGHFENMLSIDMGASKTEWRYGPFLTTRLSSRTAASYEAIAGPDRNRSTFSQGEYLSVLTLRGILTSADYHFNWTVTYRAMSPTKLSLFEYRDWAELFNAKISEYAQRHDQRELYSESVSQWS